MMKMGIPANKDLNTAIASTKIVLWSDYSIQYCEYDHHPTEFKWLNPHHCIVTRKDIMYLRRHNQDLYSDILTARENIQLLCQQHHEFKTSRVDAYHFQAGKYGYQRLNDLIRSWIDRGLTGVDFNIIEV